MRLGRTPTPWKAPLPPLGLILGLSAFPAVPRGDVGLVGDTEIPWGLLSAGWDKGSPVLGLDPGPGGGSGVTQGPCCPWLLLGALAASPGNKSQCGGSVCHLCVAVTAECHQPTQCLAKHPQAPQGAGMVLGLWNLELGFPLGSAQHHRPCLCTGQVKLGHCFPSSNIISVFLFFFPKKKKKY